MEQRGISAQITSVGTGGLGPSLCSGLVAVQVQHHLHMALEEMQVGTQHPQQVQISLQWAAASFPFPPPPAAPRPPPPALKNFPGSPSTAGGPPLTAVGGHARGNGSQCEILVPAVPVAHYGEGSMEVLQ